jgi:hypothetical protein
MARGQAGAAEKQLHQTNVIGAQQGEEAQALENKLMPGYESLANTGYLSPEEEAAATTSEMGAATQPFETGKFQARNNAAATRNDSNLAAQEDQMALNEGRAAGTAASQLQLEKMANEEAGLSDIQGLQSEHFQGMENMYGLGPATLQARAAGTLPHGGSYGPVSASGCWVAAALYGGWDDPRTIDVRRWLNTEFVKRPIGRVVMKLYLRFGERVAELVKRSAMVRAILRPLFDLALRNARG